MRFPYTDTRLTDDLERRLIAQEIDDYSFREGARAGVFTLAVVVGSLLALGALSLVMRFF